MASRKSRPRFQVGDRVRWSHFLYPFLRGTVVEVQGPSYDGRCRYVVGIDDDPFEPGLRTVTEEQLEPDLEPPAPLEKTEILRFLTNSGLIRILMTNPSPEGPNNPRVWLCRDQTGNITHTLAAERGMVGGAPVPYAAFWGSDGIRAEKRDEVAAYLTTFGLTPEEAEDVIRAVGVYPLKRTRRPKARTA